MISRFTACILTLDTWQLAWRHHDEATNNYAFYHGTEADIGLSDPVFQKRMNEAGIDPKTQPNEAVQCGLTMSGMDELGLGKVTVAHGAMESH
jgi:hypothetical protein